VGESEWMFKTTINVTEEELAAEHVDLVFEGLDTFAVIKLVCRTTRKTILPYNFCPHRMVKRFLGKCIESLAV
jgi:hypothetical protein